MNDYDQLSLLLFYDLDDSVGTSARKMRVLFGICILTLSLEFVNLLQGTPPSISTKTASLRWTGMYLIK